MLAAQGFYWCCCPQSCNVACVNLRFVFLNLGCLKRALRFDVGLPFSVSGIQTVLVLLWTVFFLVVSVGGGEKTTPRTWANTGSKKQAIGGSAAKLGRRAVGYGWRAPADRWGPKAAGAGARKEDAHGPAGDPEQGTRAPKTVLLAQAHRLRGANVVRSSCSPVCVRACVCCSLPGSVCPPPVMTLPLFTLHRVLCLDMTHWTAQVLSAFCILPCCVVDTLSCARSFIKLGQPIGAHYTHLVLLSAESVLWQTA